MKNPGFHIEFGGFDSEAEATAFSKELKSELPDWPSSITKHDRLTDSQVNRDAGLTIAIITLFVALPSGVKDSFDLADRIRLKEKFDRLIAWAKERRAKQIKNPFVVLRPHQASKPLEEITSADLLDAVADQVKKPPVK